MAIRSAPVVRAEVAPASTPSDAVVERINDPAIAAALVTILDNAELLSTLVIGLSGFVERGDTIAESVATAVSEFKAAGVGLPALDLPSLDEVRDIVGALSASMPTLTAALDSGLLGPQNLALVSMLTASLSEGLTRARQDKTKVSGAIGALKALKDPEVARGVGALIEVARSLGRRVGSAETAHR